MQQRRQLCKILLESSCRCLFFFDAIFNSLVSMAMLLANKIRRQIILTALELAGRPLFFRSRYIVAFGASLVTKSNFWASKTTMMRKFNYYLLYLGNCNIRPTLRKPFSLCFELRVQEREGWTTLVGRRRRQKNSELAEIIRTRGGRVILQHSQGELVTSEEMRNAKRNGISYSPYLNGSYAACRLNDIRYQASLNAKTVLMHDSRLFWFLGNDTCKPTIQLKKKIPCRLCDEMQVLSRTTQQISLQNDQQLGSRKTFLHIWAWHCLAPPPFSSARVSRISHAKCIAETKCIG